MEYLNLIPLAALAWYFLTAIKKGMTPDYTSQYFQKHRRETGKKFHNFFGINSVE